MALDKQVIPIPFAQGIDTKSDPKQVPAGKLLQLFNGVFQSAKRILKRFGYEALNTDIIGGTNISSGVSSRNYNNELILLDGESFYTFSEEGQNWKKVGPFSTNSVTADEIVSRIDRTQIFDSIKHPNGYTGVTYDSSGSAALRVAVRDEITGAVLLDLPINSGVNHAKIQALGNYIIVIFTRSTTLEYFAIDTTNLTSVLSGIIASDVSGSRTIDIKIKNSNLYIGYASSGPTALSFYYITPSLVISSKFSAATASGNVRYICIDGDASNNIWVLYYDFTSSTLYATIYSEFFAAVVLAETVISIVPQFNGLGMAIRGTTANIYFGLGSLLWDSAVGSIDKITLTIAGTVGSLTPFALGVSLYARPFIYNGVIYVPTIYSSTILIAGFTDFLQPTVFLIDENQNVVSKVLSLNIDPIFTPNNPLPNSYLSGPNAYSFPSLLGTVLGSFSGALIRSNSINISTITFKHQTTSVKSSDELIVSGGISYIYDGINLVEYGFNLFPDYITMTALGVGPGPGIGTYQYAAIYEWVDAKGNHYRSAPSPIGTITVAGAGAVNVTVPTLRLTGKTGSSSVLISLYRTSANGSTLKRITRNVAANINIPTNGSITITDSVTDTAQASGDILYTTGGEVENISPPAFDVMCTYRNRIMLAPSEDINVVWYSKEFVENFPAEFSDVFTMNVDAIGGKITAMLQMDDKFIIFKKKNILYMTGQGPASNGANNDFSPPLLINSDVGADSQQSVVLMPNGIMFKSQKGIYLIDRSLSVQYIGADVETYNGQQITSSQLMDEVNQVRFTLDSGVALMYDYYFQQWSVFTGIDAKDSCVFEKKFTYLKSDGTTLQESATDYSDDGSFYPLKLKTAWLSMSGIQGFQRIYKTMLLGDKKGSHTLRVTLYRDFNSTPVQVDDIDATAINPAVYQWRVFPIIQKCEAIQLEIQDIQSAAFNEGFDISDLTLEVGGKRGAFKLPAAQSSS